MKMDRTLSSEEVMKVHLRFDLMTATTGCRHGGNGGDGDGYGGVHHEAWASRETCHTVDMKVIPGRKSPLFWKLGGYIRIYGRRFSCYILVLYDTRCPSSRGRSVHFWNLDGVTPYRPAGDRRVCVKRDGLGVGMGRDLICK